MMDVNERRRTAFGWECICIYLNLTLYITAIAFTVVPAVAKAELVISAKSFEVTSESAYVIATATLIHSGTKVLLTKYGAALSDYTGRKPMICVTILFYIISRLILLTATTKASFYLVALIWGLCDVTFPVSQAWLCDLLALDSRGQAFGLLIGIGFGIGFSIGLPMGAFISQEYGPDTAIWVSLIIAVIYFVYMLLLPIPDLLGVKSPDKQRSVPASGKAFLKEHHPLSFLPILHKGAGSVFDWYSYIPLQLCARNLQSNLLLYLQATVQVTQLQAGVILMLLGVGVAIFAPVLLRTFLERGLFTWCIIIEIVAYILLSLVGAFSTHGVQTALLYISLTLIVIGSVAGSALTALITAQYSSDMLGEVLGISSQIQESATVLVYPAGLLLAYTIEKNSFDYSGIIWWFSVIFLSASAAFQIQGNSFNEVMYLVWRTESSKTDGGDNNNRNNDRDGLSASSNSTHGSNPDNYVENPLSDSISLSITSSRNPPI